MREGRALEVLGAEENKINVHTWYEEDRSSTSSYDAQAGVKRIEAISQSWTRWLWCLHTLGMIFIRIMWKIECIGRLLCFKPDVKT